MLLVNKPIPLRLAHVIDLANRVSDETLIRFFRARRWQDEELFETHSTERLIFFGAACQLLADLSEPACVMQTKRVLSAMSHAGWVIDYQAIGRLTGTIAIASAMKQVVPSSRAIELVEKIWLPSRSENQQQ